MSFEDIIIDQLKNNSVDKSSLSTTFISKDVAIEIIKLLKSNTFIM